jgi:hypothetical protein
MPILERDPWRFQYFEGISCPSDVDIPTDDPDCWNLFPQHRWIYDRLKIAESQGMACGPHGVKPRHFPVFSKPIINLKGMGLGSKLIATEAEWDCAYEPGHMWMELCTGEHVSTDCAVEKGEIKWLRHATGEAAPNGTFKHWTIHAATKAELEKFLRAWTAQHLGTYCGMVNFETIGGRIIEAHLRFADQWCDLYGPGWIDALVKFYTTGHWQFDDGAREDGFSIPLFARHGLVPPHPSAEAQAEIRALAHVKSLQITYYAEKAGDHHPMPPGGFRLAVINCDDLNAGFAARRALAKSFAGVELMLPE